MTDTPNHRNTHTIARELAAAVALTHTLAHEMKEAMDRYDLDLAQREKKLWRQRRYDHRRRQNRKKQRELAQKDAENRKIPDSKEPHWRGVTWRDMPGKHESEKKLNLSLLKARDLPRFRSCYDLNGDELKAELSRLIQQNRDKSLRVNAEQKAKNQPQV